MKAKDETKTEKKTKKKEKKRKKKKREEKKSAEKCAVSAGLCRHYKCLKVPAIRFFSFWSFPSGLLFHLPTNEYLTSLEARLWLLH